MKSILIAALLMLVAGCGAAPNGSDSSGSTEIAGAAGAPQSASAGSAAAGSASPNSDTAGAPSAAGAPPATQELPESPNVSLAWTVKQFTALDMVDIDVLLEMPDGTERVAYSNKMACSASGTSGLFLAPGNYKVTLSVYGPSFLESYPKIFTVSVGADRVALPSMLEFKF